MTGSAIANGILEIQIFSRQGNVPGHGSNPAHGDAERIRTATQSAEVFPTIMVNAQPQAVSTASLTKCGFARFLHLD